MRSIGGHQLRETLGRGATATVFRATGPAGEVALKVARRDVPRAAARLARECDVLARLRGQRGVVPLLDHGVDEGVPWLALPVLAVAQPNTGALIHALARALAAAHAAGWTHGDVAPPHVMVGREGRLWLIDWGSARAVEQSSPSRDVERLAVAACRLLEPGSEDMRGVAERAERWSTLLLQMMHEDPAARPSAAELVTATVGAQA